MNALNKVLRSLEWKHLKIRLALTRALLVMVEMCCDMVSLLSINQTTTNKHNFFVGRILQLLLTSNETFVYFNTVLQQCKTDQSATVENSRHH